VVVVVLGLLLPQHLLVRVVQVVVGQVGQQMETVLPEQLTQAAVAVGLVVAQAGH
jgi:hypothetical protein